MMHPVQSLLTKVTRLSMGRIINQPVSPIVNANAARWAVHSQQRHYVQRVDQYRKKTTTLQSMREFFMHPLTWDRNNGYLNVVLALAIFSFVFINSCTPCPEDRMPRHKKNDN
ncbi:uncharacterized protein LOC115767560 [Drosophila novamexicana]|uniref:uncharacterized protein LOC115767560 n=1 Tax=Drosophila novamexicana TaxID=47314 RepID=UPI0011E5E229|nr:uncharacterized protein LOC115767560 [Drosophila novamexicana]